MISQSTVLMATPIALLATERGIDLHDKAGKIIQGLNECTASINGFTEDNIAIDLPDYTKAVGEHTEILEETTTIIADRIRSALELISQTVKPILKDTESRIRSEIDPGNVADTIFDYLNVEMVNIEPSFLNSPFYPNSVPASFSGVDSIRLADLLQGTYPSMSGEDLVDLIAVNVDELRGFYSSPSEVKDIYDTLFVEKNWFELFSASTVKGGVVDLGDYANYAFKSFRPLVIGSMLLNRLVSQDDPLEGVTGVGLNEYRTSLLVARDLFNTMLYKFKQIWESRAAAGMVIIGDKVRQEVADYGNLVGVEVLAGTLLIGYNNAVLTMFADAQEMSLSEFAVGYMYAKLRGKDVKDIITSKEIVTDAWKIYASTMRAALLSKKSTVAKRAFVQVLEGLSSKEAFLPFIETIDSNIHINQRILQRVQQKIEIGAFFENMPMLDAVIREETSLMNTVLAGILADAFDCPIAQEILMINAANPAGTLEQQRKALSHAIDEVILKRLITL